jgi:hypothetical protein
MSAPEMNDLNTVSLNYLIFGWSCFRNANFEILYIEEILLTLFQESLFDSFDSKFKKKSALGEKTKGASKRLCGLCRQPGHTRIRLKTVIRHS